jgi:2-oxoisovalerate dehydrogenase E1 component beta subunit
MGMRPIAEMQFIDFIGCCFNQLVNYAAKSRFRWGGGVPIVVRGPCGGGVHGGPFHSQNPEAFFMNVPGLKIVAPGTAADAKGLMTAAIRDPDPVIYLEHKFLYRRIKEELPDGELVVPIGKARLARPGKDVSIVTYAAMLHVALEAAEARPGTASTSRSWTCGRSAARRGGDPGHGRQDGQGHRPARGHTHRRAGGEIAALISERAFEYLDAPVIRMAPPDTPGALLAAARGVLPAQRGEGRQGHPGASMSIRLALRTIRENL